MSKENLRKFEKNFKVILNSDKAGFNKLLDEIGAKERDEFYKNESYAKSIDELLTSIKDIYNTDIMKYCISLVRDKFEISHLYFDCNFKKKDIIIRDFVKYVYDNVTLKKDKQGNIKSNKINLINPKCLYDFKSDYRFTDKIKEGYTKAYVSIRKERLVRVGGLNTEQKDNAARNFLPDISLLAKNAKNEDNPNPYGVITFDEVVSVTTLKHYLEKELYFNFGWVMNDSNAENKYKDSKFSTYSYDTYFGKNDLDDENIMSNLKIANRLGDVVSLEDFFNGCETLDDVFEVVNLDSNSKDSLNDGYTVRNFVQTYKNDIYDVCRDILCTSIGMDNSSDSEFLEIAQLVCNDRILDLCIDILIFIQNIIHINAVSNSSLNTCVEQLTMFKFNSSGSPIGKCYLPFSFDIILDIYRYLVKNVELADELGSKFNAISRIELDLGLYVMPSAGINMSSYTEGKSFSITKTLLTKLCIHIMINSGELRHAYIHKDKGGTLNKDLIYVYNEDDKCWRYFDVDDYLRILKTKLHSIIKFSDDSNVRASDFIYNTGIGVKDFVLYTAEDRDLTFRLREPLNYTAFIVDNGTIILNKLTGEFIFCENLFSYRVMTMYKFKGSFDKHIFERGYKSLDTNMAIYTKYKIKNGRKSDGSLNQDVYGLLMATMLNFLQPDMVTHNAVVIIGPKGDGKTLLLEGLDALNEYQKQSNIWANIGIDTYTGDFVNTSVEKYLNSTCSEFPITEFRDNSMFKKVLEGAHIQINPKHKDSVGIDVNTKFFLCGETFMKIKTDGGLKERFVVFESVKKIVDFEGLDNSNVIKFLAYDITNTMRSFYDGFMFQLNNNVFKENARIYHKLFAKYNKDTYQTYIEENMRVHGIERVIEINPVGVLDQNDLAEVMAIAERSSYDTAVRSVSFNVLIDDMKTFRDFNDNSNIAVNIHQRNNSKLKQQCPSLQRHSYSIGVSFNTDFIEGLSQHLKIDEVRYKADIKKLERIKKTYESFGGAEFKFLLEKSGQHKARFEESLKLLEENKMLQEKKQSVLNDVIASIDSLDETLNDSKTLSPTTHQDKQDLLN
jgi:hypothetical protein